MSQAAREAALAHFGVPGMKWGVRKSHQRATRTINETIKKISPRPEDPRDTIARGDFIMKIMKENFGGEKVSVLAMRETVMKTGERYVDSILQSDAGRIEILTVGVDR